MKEKKLNYIRSLLSEFGVKLPVYPEDEEIIDALTDALGEAQNQREELLEDLTPDCSICRYEWRLQSEEPCCRCEGCSEFVWHGFSDDEEGERTHEDFSDQAGHYARERDRDL